jgi:hypothetical protein
LYSSSGGLSIKFLEGFFYVSGNSNVIYKSSNGVSWSTFSTISNAGVSSVNDIITNTYNLNGNGVANNSTSTWVTVGEGDYSIAYSTTAIPSSFTSVTTSIFSIGNDVTWTGSRFVAVGTGSSNTIAYSSNGSSWVGLGATIFTIKGNRIFTFPSYVMASGVGTNSLAYSTNGTQWTGLGTTIFNIQGFGIAYGNSRYIATGFGSTNTLAYSNDGIK